MLRFVLRTAPVVLATLLALPAGLAGQASGGDTAAVHAAVTGFLQAFEDLDWPRFRAAFSDDVTAFFPIPEPPQRFVGRAAVEAQFQRVFAAIRAAAPSGPPYQHLQPVGLRIEMVDDAVALVSFELRNARRIGRRTLVMRREAGNWRIVHLHASNVPLPVPAPPSL
jgi:ketosteroid isomerase-like protein